MLLLSVFITILWPNIPALPIPIAFAANEGNIFTYRQAAAETIETTLSNASFDTLVVEESGYSISGDTDVTLSSAGHYLVLYNMTAGSTGGSNRSEMNFNLELNGADLPYGWSGCYIRRSGGTDECFTSGGAIIDAPGAGQVLQVEMQRTDSNTATVDRRANESGLMILKLDDTWDYARISESGGGQTFYVPSFQTITWDTDDELDTGSFAHTGSGEITLTTSGHYLITVNVFFHDSSASLRENAEMRLTLDDTEIDGSRVAAYIRGSDGTQDMPTYWNGIISPTTGNQILRVQAAQEGETNTDSNITNIGDKSAISIVKLPDDGDYIRLGETVGGQSVDTAAVITWDDEPEEDIGSFSHDTGSNPERINIDKDDDYLILSSFYSNNRSTTNTARMYPVWSFRKDGSALQYGKYGIYNRGDQSTKSTFTSGQAGGVILANLTSSNWMEMYSNDESTGTDATHVYMADRMHFQGVNINSIIAPSSASISQIHFRWRDDTLDLNASGGWLAIEDSNATGNISRNSTYRLRMELANTSDLVAQDMAKAYELQWGDKGSNDNCSSISSWTGVSDSSDEFALTSTTHITPDGEATTGSLLVNSETYTFINGEGRESADTTAALGPLSTENFTELEFSLQATDTAITGNSYCFRIYDSTSGATLNSYAQFPELTLDSTTSTGSTILEWDKIENVDDTSWTLVTFSGSYAEPIFMCSPQYGDNIGNEGDATADAIVCRIQNVTSTSALIQLQEPGVSTLATSENVHWMVSNSGAYSDSNITYEAWSNISTVTDSKTNSYIGEAQSYRQSYTNPVVLGSVSTYNDPDWSVFYAIGTSLSSAPDASGIRIGKHVAEDSDIDRSNETLTTFVFEQSTGESLGSTEYEVQLQSQTIDRVDDVAPDSYTFVTTFSSTPQVALVSLAAVSGSDGPHPHLYGTSPLSTTTINAVTFEDEIVDAEQTGNEEFAPYIVFQNAGTYNSNTAYDQLTYRFYENNNEVQPAVAMAAENTAITEVATNDVVRIRMALQTGLNDTGTGTHAFNLQYGTGSDCGSIGVWQDVGGFGSSEIWRGFNATPADGASITASLLNSQANKLQSYEETNPSVTAPENIRVGENGEWDWVMENNGAPGGISYCFRMTLSNGDPVYYSSYPQMTTAAAAAEEKKNFFYFLE
jgi:hypothetical protein